MDTPLTLGARLKQLLKDSGHTQQQAAELLGRTPQYVWMVANDRARPGKDFLGDLVRIYGLDLDEWSGYAGHRPEHAAEDPAVEAAELALAAAGWEFDPEFGEALARVCGDRTVEDLAAIMRHKPAFLAAALRGWVPDGKGILLDWAQNLDLDVSAADQLFKAAGHGGWNPLLSFVEGAEGLALVMGVSAPAVESRSVRAASWATPREVERWQTAARERLFCELDKIPDGSASLHWVIRLPEIPGGEVIVTVRWETTSAQLAGSVADAQRTLDALPTLSETVAAWAPIISAVSELARLCEERDCSIPFDFRRLSGLTNSAAVADVVAAARLQAEGEPQ